MSPFYYPECIIWRHLGWHIEPKDSKISCTHEMLIQNVLQEFFQTKFLVNKLKHKVVSRAGRRLAYSVLFFVKFSKICENYFFIWANITIFHYWSNKNVKGTVVNIENRIYIREEFRESLGMNFFSPFQPEREFKVYTSCKCSQIICSRVH